MEDEWFDDALRDDPLNGVEDDEYECPICGDDAGHSCPCVRDE